MSRDAMRICALCENLDGTSGNQLTVQMLAVHSNPVTEAYILQTITHLNVTPVPGPLFAGSFCAILGNGIVHNIFYMVISSPNRIPLRRPSHGWCDGLDKSSDRAYSSSTGMLSVPEF